MHSLLVNMNNLTKKSIFRKTVFTYIGSNIKKIYIYIPLSIHKYLPVIINDDGLRLNFRH